MYNLLDSIPACDRRTDRRTSCDGIDHATHTCRAVKMKLAPALKELHSNVHFRNYKINLEAVFMSSLKDVLSDVYKHRSV